MRCKITVSAVTFVLLPFALLLIPLRWILAWTAAVSVHELGHYLTLRLFRVPVWALEISPFGIRMYTGAVEDREMLVCALAGPVTGFLLIFLSRFLPCSALCAFIHSAFNLLPVYPFDGGRVLRAGLALFSLRDKVAAIIETVAFLCTVAVSACFFLYFRLGIVPLLLLCGILTQKFLANRRNNSYNSGRIIFEVSL